MTDALPTGATPASVPPFLRKAFLSWRKLYWALAALTLAADLATKHLMQSYFRGGHPNVVLVPNVLALINHPGNVRGVWGMGPASPAFHVALAATALAVLTVLFVLTDPDRALPQAALGLVSGGAIGNLADRVALGVVRDFIDLHWRDVYHWPTFNVADMAICVGFALIVWDAFTRQHKDAAPAAPAEGPQAPDNPPSASP